MKAEDLAVLTNGNAERAVIASLIIIPRLYPRVSEILTRDDFWAIEHQQTWDAIDRVLGAGSELNMYTLCAELDGCIDDIGGVSFLALILDDMPLKTQIGDNVWAVLEASARRRLFYASERVIAYCREDGDLGDIGKLARNEMKDALESVKKAVRRKV